MVSGIKRAALGALAIVTLALGTLGSGVVRTTPNAEVAIARRGPDLAFALNDEGTCCANFIA